MKTLLDILKLSKEFLEQRKIANPRRQAEELIADCLELNRMQLYMQYDRPMTEAELVELRSRLARRAKGEPLQYIRGKVEFLNCMLLVSKAVLIPRQETEILADKMIKSLESENLENKTLLDVCCGSGCIGISIKKKFPHLNVVCSDISSEALEIAKKNAELNHVDVEFILGDLLKPFDGRKADFVVCNPPYIAENEYLNLEIEVRDFEPKDALISGVSGLEFYVRLSRELPKAMKSKGKIWFEMGTGQGKAINNLFVGAPWVSCRVEQDWSGHDRFFFLEIE
jgi:release factor glutamine methyltransferase